MITPKEPPHIACLNSYFIEPDRLLPHMQRELGSGCIYCRSSSREIMVYFSPVEVIACLSKDIRRALRQVLAVADVAAALGAGNFQISVYYLDLNAVYFWGQMPPYRWQETLIITRSRFFLDLVDGYREARFSGFLDLDTRSGAGVAFFEHGHLLGGSYSWGRGGLSPLESDFQRLAEMAGIGKNRLRIGRFETEPAAAGLGAGPFEKITQAHPRP